MVVHGELKCVFWPEFLTEENCISLKITVLFLIVVDSKNFRRKQRCGKKYRL
jgi:hypothetical protein